MTNPAQFIQQTRAEIAKVVWPARREVVLTTIMVFIMATLTAIFFSLVDLAIRGLLDLGGGLGFLSHGCKRCVDPVNTTECEFWAIEALVRTRQPPPLNNCYFRVSAI